MDSQNDAVRRILGTVITYAFRDHAQEIRIQPHAAGVVVHYRVQDEWREQLSIPKYVLSPLTKQLVDLAKLHGETSENPRQGTIELTLKDDLLQVTLVLPIQVRLFPDEYGQRIHLEILRPT